MTRQPRGETWEVEWWPEPAHDVSGDGSAAPTTILVPDRERGGFKKHEIQERPKGRLGF